MIADASHDHRGKPLVIGDLLRPKVTECD